MRLKLSLYRCISYCHRLAVRIISSAVDCNSAKMSLSGSLPHTLQECQCPSNNLKNSLRAQGMQKNASIAEDKVGLSEGFWWPMTQL